MVLFTLLWVDCVFMSRLMGKPTMQCGFQIGPTQTELYKHRKWLEAGNFGFRK